MWKRLMATFLALAALPALAPARQPPPFEEPTPEEEREARDLARQFVERLRENNDVAPLVEEMFVRDLGARLRHTQEDIPMGFLTPEVAARAGADELKRFYVAEFNFFSRTLAYLTTRRDELEENEEDESPEKWYPPEVLSALKGDPFMAFVIADREARQAAEREQAGENGAAGSNSTTQPAEEDDDRFIKDLAMLRAATDTSGRAADVLRAYAPEFSALRRAQEARVPQEAFEDVQWMHLDTREEEYMGYPPGTRFIRINVEPAYDVEFALTLVREDGRLRILVAVPCFGD